jgi:hypothetical protein
MVSIDCGEFVMGSPHDTRRICEGCDRWIDKHIETRYCPPCEMTRKMLLKLMWRKDEGPDAELDLTVLIRKYRSRDILGPIDPQDLYDNNLAYHNLVDMLVDAIYRNILEVNDLDGMKNIVTMLVIKRGMEESMRKR